jgi:hypothetical protein
LIWATTQVVNELRLECAGKDAIGRARTPTAVAWSLQRYLIFAILCCIPGKPLPILPHMACHRKVSNDALCCCIHPVLRSWQDVLADPFPVMEV